MGARVLGCGHASQLFKVEYVESCPQVHLHFLTDDDEYNREEEGKVEIVCHGCGDSLLVRYDTSSSRRQFLALRNRFKDSHKSCPNLKYETKCLDYRRTAKVTDIRKPARRSRAA